MKGIPGVLTIIIAIIVAIIVRIHIDSYNNDNSHLSTDVFSSEPAKDFVYQSNATSALLHLKQL